MELIAPGRKEENIRRRLTIGESITNTRSKTEFERQPLERIEHQVSILMALERYLRNSPTKDDAELKVAVQRAILEINQAKQVAPKASELHICERPNGKSVARSQNSEDAPAEIF